DLVQMLVGRAHKGTAISVLEGIGTVMAVVWQPMAGAISDRWVSPLGRRRPFIIAGTVGDVIFLAGLALSGSYWVLVIFYPLLHAFLHPFSLDLRRHRDFAWLMGSRLLILMGIVGLQSFAFFYFSDVYFAGDRKQTTVATSVLLGLVVLVGLLVTWPAAKLC